MIAVHTIASKPTLYRGVNFRSRLEARWAVFFYVSKIQYLYEPCLFKLRPQWYLIDFWLHDGQTETWAEVKPVAFTEAEIEKCRQVANLTGLRVLQLVGPPNVINGGRAAAIANSYRFEDEDEKRD